MQKIQKHALLLGILTTLACIALSVWMGMQCKDAGIFLILLTVTIFVPLIYSQYKLYHYLLVLVLLVIIGMAAAGYPGMESTLSAAENILFYGMFGSAGLFMKYFMKKAAFREQELSEQEKSVDDMFKLAYAKCMEARKANRAKSDFLSQMSHEIRTPINAILGMNEMIMRESEDKQILEYADAVSNSAAALLSIVNEILDISKIEAGKMEIVPAEYEIASLAVDSYNMTINRAESKGLILQVKCDEAMPVRLVGDMFRLRQILLNLLSNAVKYTEKGQIILRLGGTAAREDRFELMLQVEDTGIGMTEESLQRLFEKFERFDLRRNQGIEGTGLGMPITQQLVKLMDGTIEVSSTLGKGSVFTVKLPQAIADPTPLGCFDIHKQRSDKNVKHTQRKFHAETARILVVDDVEMNLRVFQSLLRRNKVSIDLASSGQKCLEMTAACHYDMIFMDHMMPVMDGIETFHRMQGLTKNPNRNTPVIMLTANALTGMQQKYLEEGFTDYLSKPVNGETLENMLLKYLPENKIRYEEEEPQKQITPVSVEPEHGMGLAGLKKYVPDLDVEHSLDYCGGEENFYIELLQDFADQWKQERLSGLYEKKDLENYAVEVHGLKGSARILGFRELGDMAEKMQFAAQAQNLEYMKLHHEELLQKYAFIAKCIECL